jgi:hypothetical protein
MVHVTWKMAFKETGTLDNKRSSSHVIDRLAVRVEFSLEETLVEQLLEKPLEGAKVNGVVPCASFQFLIQIDSVEFSPSGGKEFEHFVT